MAQVEAEQALGVQRVDAPTLKAWLAAGEAVLVDVRERHEYEACHIPGAVLVPLSTFDAAHVPAAAGQRLVVACQAGMRAMDAARRLVKAGRPTVWCFDGSLNGWQACGYATEGAQGAAERASACAVAPPRLTVQRQMQIIVGTMILAFALLAALVSPKLVWLELIPGLGMLNAGLTGLCPMIGGLARLPWNRSC
jgi:rhodanese-related sulfurtransferase